MVSLSHKTLESLQVVDGVIAIEEIRAPHPGLWPEHIGDHIVWMRAPTSLEDLLVMRAGLRDCYAKQ